MSEFALTTPVAFLIFNRPDTTARVFEEIRRARPPKLLIVADGPRANRPDDVAKCAAVRAVVANIDWDCEVLTNYSDVNLGCGKRVSSGLNWVFNTVAEAIVLEDDCLPTKSFFRFCQELLERYRMDERIMHIAGSSFRNLESQTTQSYYFSVYNHIWGWASWSRAWQHYDFDMRSWPHIGSLKSMWKALWGSNIAQHWIGAFQNSYDKKIDTWDYQWTFACWRQNGLSIVPVKNLITNIGFGESATHTKSKDSKVANLPAFEISFPVFHPHDIHINYQFDKLTGRQLFASSSLKSRVGRVIKSAMS